MRNWVEDYCNGFENCNENFYEIYSCLDGCFTEQRIWGNCLEKIDDCIADDTCYDEIGFMYSLEDTFGDISNFMMGQIGTFYFSQVPTPFYHSNPLLSLL